MIMGSWQRPFAGFYKRIAADGKTEIAKISRTEDGTWAVMITPFGRAQLGWQLTGIRTLAAAKTAAEYGYRSYMAQHKAINSKTTD
jgi:hypothetical protein